MTRRAGPIEGRRLFSFAVISDTHVNASDAESSSPWLANRLANARTRALADYLKGLDIEFVVHLGDMVHPVPAQPGYSLAADCFRQAFAQLPVPLHLIPGNHDIGDKPTAWTPAAPITAASLRAYREQFGRDRHAFEHGGCRFVTMNSELLNSGLADEAEQWAWLETQLVPGHRLFLFKHYPLFLFDEAEDEHYDNIAEPARTRLIDLIRRSGVEAVFAGHVHNLFYNRIGAADAYVLPTTTAMRHDYMELFPVPPPDDDEFGRNARPKLGFFLVDVHERGHVAHWVRTWGATDAHAIPEHRLSRPSVRGGRSAPFGVDLRYGWADPVVIPHTGVVDEFGRKRVRNDYLLAGLEELGLGRLRVPIQDVVEAHAARRMEEVAARGHRFTVFAFGIPDSQARTRLADLASHLDAVEIVSDQRSLSRTVHEAAALRAELGVPAFVSRLHVTADSDHRGAQLAHFILHGFKADDARAAADLLRAAPDIDGLAFRIDPGESVWTSLEAIAAGVAQVGKHAIAHVRMTGAGPARPVTDDAAVARRVADAALSAWAYAGRLRVFLDTFCDHDRGYFPRHGLTDRRFDPRPSGHVLANLVARFAGIQWGGVAIEGTEALRVIRKGNEALAIVVVEPSSLSGRETRRLLQPFRSRTLSASRLDNGAAVTAAISADGTLSLSSNDGAGMPLIIDVA